MNTAMVNHTTEPNLLSIMSMVHNHNNCSNNVAADTSTEIILYRMEREDTRKTCWQVMPNMNKRQST